MSKQTRLTDDQRAELKRLHAVLCGKFQEYTDAGAELYEFVQGLGDQSTLFDFDTGEYDDEPNADIVGDVEDLVFGG